MNITFDPDRLAKSTNTIQVEMVRDETNGLVIDVLSWIGEQTEGDMAKLRTGIRLKQVKFTCLYCGHPLLLRKHRYGGHYFAHMEKTASEKANCLYQQPSIISTEDRDRIRYQGQREGARHIRTKNLIASIIGSDSRFSDILVEQVWKTFQDGWRRPDVSAVYNGIKVVFEAQVSNTYPQVVAERTNFYKKQNCILIWIYDSIDDSDWRALHSDNFCSNGQHIFYVDDECLSVSRLDKNKEAYFKVYTQRPDVTAYQSEDKTWLLRAMAIKKCDIIPFSQLRIDVENQTVTYFDISMERWKTEHKILCAAARVDDNWTSNVFRKVEESLRFVLGRKREITKQTVLGWVALICALESARLDKPIGTRYENIYSTFNLFYDCHPQFILAFAMEIEKFGHTTETASGEWKARLVSLKAGKYRVKKGCVIDVPQPHPLTKKLLTCLY